MRVKRFMQKIRWPKDVDRPTSVRAPGLRLTFTGDEPRDMDLPFIEAQILMSRFAVKFVNKPYQKEVDVKENEVLSGDVILPPKAPASAKTLKKQ